jgi:hypothetical protein
MTKISTKTTKTGCNIIITEKCRIETHKTSTLALHQKNSQAVKANYISLFLWFAARLKAKSSQSVA